MPDKHGRALRTSRDSSIAAFQQNALISLLL